jgi:hypothetical protein
MSTLLIDIRALKELIMIDPQKTDTFSSYDWNQIIGDLIHPLRYGVVQIVVHEAKVVRIERTEKLRVDNLPTRELAASPINTTAGVHRSNGNQPAERNEQ